MAEAESKPFDATRMANEISLCMQALLLTIDVIDELQEFCTDDEEDVRRSRDRVWALTRLMKLEIERADKLCMGEYPALREMTRDANEFAQCREQINSIANKAA